MIRVFPLAAGLALVALLTCGCDRIAAFSGPDARPRDAGGDSTDDTDISPSETAPPDADGGCASTADGGCVDAAVTKIVYGDRHACVLVDGTVRCWGDNDRGQRGTLAATQLAATHVVLDEPVSDLCANGENTCAIDVHGVVSCWGANDHGQLAITGSKDSGKPLPISGVAAATHVGCGDGFVCAVTQPGGVVYCWGRGDLGQLGSPTSSNVPLRVANTSNVDAIACGRAHCCVIAGGAVSCWGDPSRTKLGSPLANAPALALRVNVPTASAISSYADHTCIATDNKVVCWGDNRSVQLTGLNATSEMAGPSSAPLSDTVSSVAVGAAHTCATTKAGTVTCWGDDRYGQLGRGIRALRDPNRAPVGQLPAGAFVQRVFAGANNTCVVTSLGVYCWGRNTYGQVSPQDPAARIALGAAPTVSLSSVTAGGYHTCARDGTTGIKCWGLNVNAQGTSSAAALLATPTPRPLFPSLGGIAAGYEHTCARAASAIACFGRGDGGQLDGTVLGARVPALRPVGPFLTVQALALGRQHSCALATTGAVTLSVYCWGSDDHGQIGHGAGASVVTAQFALGDVEQVSAAGDTTCAVTNNSELYCWGRNDAGQLGDGTTSDRNLPKRVGDAQLFRQVSVGREHVCAVGTDTAVYCWGRNRERQIGTSVLDTRTPQKVVSGAGALTGVSKVAVGGLHSCALQKGNVVCWGDNRALQAGGKAPGFIGPTALQLADTVGNITAGEAHTCFELDSGVMCFGDNFFSQIGSGPVSDWLPHLVTF